MPLFETHTVEQWTGTTALAIRPSRPSCVVCEAETMIVKWRQDALPFLFGGYGAAIEFARHVCPYCGWSRAVEISTRSPRGGD